MKNGDLTRLIFGLLSWVLFVFVPVLIVISDVRPEGRTTVGILIGLSGGAWGTVIGYYFGSMTRDKKDKKDDPE